MIRRVLVQVAALALVLSYVAGAIVGGLVVASLVGDLVRWVGVAAR